MWADITEQLLYTDHGRGGVAPGRHELAKRTYIEKARSRHDAEQWAATTGVLHSIARKYVMRAGALLTGTVRAGSKTLRRDTRLPAE